MFIVGGFNVASAEVEKVLLGLTAVEQVAVVGMPDDYFGEVGVAFVVPRQGAQVSIEEVMAYAREHLANYKVPRRVEIVDAFPLNATGKVLKTELRERARKRFLLGPRRGSDAEFL
jgi:acyl-CoA synthetase (AMP-forming)/AMP-acid ligase II